MGGGLNEPCRNTPGNECNPGFYCDYTVNSSGTTIFGTCKKRYTPDLGRLGQPCRDNKAKEGDKCGSSADFGKPRTCASGLICRSRQLLGCTPSFQNNWSCTTHLCEKPPLAQKGQMCGPSADVGAPRSCGS